MGGQAEHKPWVLSKTGGRAGMQVECSSPSYLPVPPCSGPGSGRREGREVAAASSQRFAAAVADVTFLPPKTGVFVATNTHVGSQM